MKKSRRSHARTARWELSTQSSDTFESSGHRQARLEHILRMEIESLLRDEAGDPALEGIRLISLMLSPDGGHARVGYVVEAPLGDEEEARKTAQPALERAAGFIRARLAAQLDLKRLPKLGFTFVGVVEEGGGGWLA